MKLLVHNFLSSSNLKGVKIGYPLKLSVNKVEVILFFNYLFKLKFFFIEKRS